MRIALLGDLALIGRYDLRQNSSAADRLNELARYLSKFDLVVGNLESPFTTRRKSFVPKSLHLWSNPENVRLLSLLNIGAVSLANNHIHDFGRVGVNETIATLEQAGILWYGLDGRDLQVDDQGERLTLSGFSCLSTNGTGYGKSGQPGVNLLTREALEEQLQKDRMGGRFSLLSLHWGEEDTHLPNSEHLRLVRSLARSENFIVHGHHPHVLQGVESVNDSLISYSLGNCLFDDCVSLDGRKHFQQYPENLRSVVLEVDLVDGRIEDWCPTGFEDNEEGIVFSEAPADEVHSYSQRLDLISDPANYDQLRREEIAAKLPVKSGKRNLLWLLRRLNYHSVVSRLMAIPRSRKYRKIAQGF